MSNTRTLAIAASVLLTGFSASGAFAATQTLTFDGDDCFTYINRQGEFSYGKPNYNLYDRCDAHVLLGDDSLSNEDYIQVDEGYTFDLRKMDFWADYTMGIVRDAATEEDAQYDLLEGRYEEVTAYDDFVTIQGFRDGELTTEVKFDPRVTLKPDLATFTDLTRVEFSIDAWGGNYDTRQLEDGSWLGCVGQSNRCGAAIYDNVKVKLHDLDKVAPVPLPAGALLLLTGLVGLGISRKRA